MLLVIWVVEKCLIIFLCVKFLCVTVAVEENHDLGGKKLVNFANSAEITVVICLQNVAFQIIPVGFAEYYVVAGVVISLNHNYLTCYGDLYK